MKNRFCRNTKLSEEKFMLVFSCFCKGLTATETHELSKRKKLPISRQTIARIFPMLGEYFYRKFVRHVLLKKENRIGKGKTASDEYVERAILDTFWKQLQGETDYALHRKHRTNYPTHMGVVAHLDKRWKAFNGFPRTKLVGHLGGAYYRFLAESTSEEVASNGFLRALSKDPL